MLSPPLLHNVCTLRRAAFIVATLLHVILLPRHYCHFDIDFLFISPRLLMAMLLPLRYATIRSLMIFIYYADITLRLRHDTQRYCHRLHQNIAVSASAMRRSVHSACGR